MIAYLKGTLLDASDGSVILERDGIGYELLCSASAYSRLLRDGGGAVYTYLAVRDDGMTLFGFDDLAEKNMFLKLVSVSGVGSKLGMTVLSGMSLTDLAYAIACSDVKALSSVKGLGKKTAERIILELRDAMSKEPTLKGGTVKKAPPSGDEENATLALVSLGYSRKESEEAVQNAINDGVTGLENLITAALKYFLK